MSVNIFFIIIFLFNVVIILIVKFFLKYADNLIYP